MLMLAVMVLTLLPATGVSASGHDNGDGQETCNYGEICLYDLGWSERYTNHFWYNATYDGYQWWCTVNNSYLGAVRDHMSAIRNRDSSCNVTLVNWRSWWPDEKYTVNNDGYFRDLRGVFNDKADEHVRC